MLLTAEVESCLVENGRTWSCILWETGPKISVPFCTEQCQAQGPFWKWQKQCWLLPLEGMRGGSLECRGDEKHLSNLLPYGMDMRPANHVLSLEALQLQCLVSLSLRMTSIFNDVPVSWLSDSVFPALCALTYPLTSAALHKEGLLSPQLPPIFAVRNSSNMGLCPVSVNYCWWETLVKIFNISVYSLDFCNSNNKYINLDLWFSQVSWSYLLIYISWSIFII